jgi:succinyl-diaminopimelate desuccinylase
MPRLAQRRTAEPVEPPGARVSTLNVNSVHGGQVEQTYSMDAQGRPTGDLPAPVVAHSCRAVLDRRFIAEENLEAVRQEVIDLLEELRRTRPGFDYAVRDIMNFLPTATPPGRAGGAGHGPAPSHACSVESPRSSPVPAPTTRSTSCAPASCGDCIAYGPGILDLAHQPDEYVGIQELVDSAQVMALAALQLTRGGQAPA